MAGGSTSTGRRRRAQPSLKARVRGLSTILARSRVLENTLRTLVTLVIITGLALTTWGLIVDMSTFAANLSGLIHFAGDSGTVLSSTLELFETSVLDLFGLAGPDPTGQEVGQIPITGPPEPTYSAELPVGAGLTPYQVEVDGPIQQAPPLPTLAASTPSTPGEAGSTAQPEPTASPEPPAVPGWIVIPSIGLDAPIIVSHTKTVVVDGKTFAQWEAPNLFAAGWQEGSALLGEPGNTVLNGHHNIYGEVFGHLYQLNQGDEITVYAGDRMFHYAVSQVMKIEERNASLAQRQENARWVLPSTDERLTLVTCWPPTSNVYRLIVVAVPTK
jgi:LPXTG-site transpeptidase (sortase) family protein